MIQRPLHTWLIFICCLAVVLAAASWVSLTALHLEQERSQAETQADLEEKIRLALWRMESALTPWIAQESSRPYFFYAPFFVPENVYNRNFEPVNRGDVLVASPLLTQLPGHVVLHFQLDAQDQLTSPQVPKGKMRSLAEKKFLEPHQMDLFATRLEQLSRFLKREILETNCPAAPKAPVTEPVIEPNSQQLARSQGGRNQKDDQLFRNTLEQQARINTYNQAASFNYESNQRGTPTGALAEGPLRPIWFGTSLVLARQVRIQGQEYFQGSWLDWATIQSNLLATAHDLFPDAQLIPSPPASDSTNVHRLASLPVVLVPNAPAGLGTLESKPIRRLLMLALVSVVLAGIAVAFLLHGTLSLSERRAAFVSAVTHELRTPLTTFKMYSEMLADEMVPEEKRRHYLRTLCSEANRLNHLVENVLAYARLEKGSARSRVEKLSLGQLLERVQDRLNQRAEQAGVKLAIDSDPHLLKTEVVVDVSAIEQILFNLVDNACKYGQGGSEKMIHLEALPDGKWGMLRIRDHGTGISSSQSRKLFQPFSKSADEAAHSAPGVGLGLALCRRLIRDLGGDLKWDRSVTDGAAFILTLPLASTP